MMIEDFIKYIDQFIQLTEDEIQSLSQICHEKKLKKRAHFIRSAEICSKVLFFNQGYFRFYHLDPNGNEITSDFYFAPGFITSYTSLITGTPSMVNVQAMENMEILEFHKKDIYELYDLYPNLERLGRLIAESVAINSEKHLFLLLNQTAEVRYKNLLERNPKYVNTIPLQYIASYLGITRETLSRMRRTIH